MNVEGLRKTWRTDIAKIDESQAKRLKTWLSFKTNCVIG